MHLGVGGAQKIAAFVMNSLIEEGATVSVVCYFRREENVNLSPHVERIYLDVDPSPANIGFKEKIKTKTLCIRKFADILKNKNPDCAVMFGPDPLPNLALTISKFKGKVIECERGDIDARNPLFKLILKRYTRRSDMAIFQIPGAIKGYGYSLPPRVVVIPNPCGQSPTLKRDIKRVDNTIVSAGRLVIEKGFAELIEAFSFISEKHPDVILRIYGEGEERVALEHLIESLNLSDRVFLPGAIPDIGPMIVNARLFVLSSYFEGLPNTLIEAMSIGVPIVASDCTPGGARFLTKNGTIGGILVNRKSVDALAQGIDWMLDNPCEAEKLGYRGKIVTSEFNPSIISHQWIETFSELF